MPIPAGGGVPVSVDDVKLRLNKTLTVDDTEIEDMIAAAIAEYEDYVGPTTGSVTEKYDGGRSAIVLRSPHVASITTVTYDNGTAIDTADLDLDTDTGILHWAYGSAGWFTDGCRNVTITYLVSEVPENHRETIIADVVSYFSGTQRGESFLPGEGPEVSPGFIPSTLFPRIRALSSGGLA